MASLDSLPADQKAVLSLVLQRGRSFDQISAMLGIDRAAVRQRALHGFDALGPETSVEPLKRGLITDYLLGQLPPAVNDSVFMSLAGDPAERAWARVIAAELAPLAAHGLPEIPAPGATAPGRASGTASPTADSGRSTPVPAAPAEASDDDSPPSSRRDGAILLGVLAVVIIIIVVVVILLVSGGSSKKKGTTTTSAEASTSSSTPTVTSTTGTTSATPLHQINLVSPNSVKGREGAADVVKSKGVIGLVLVAEGLVSNTKNAYGVWLYDSSSGASRFLGFYDNQVTSSGKTKGELEAEVPLPANATKYNELLLTLETTEKPTKPGSIALEGTFAE